MEEYAESAGISDGVPASYHKTRKTYGLVSALLLAWELTGLEIKTSPFESVEISLDNPQAFPYVLIVLILYFAFRFSLEWFQLDNTTRKKDLIKMDFAVANAIAFFSLALFSVQAILEIQVADSFRPHTFVYVIAGIVNGALLIRTIQADQAFGIRSFRKNPYMVGIIALMDGLLLAGAILRHDGDDLLLFVLTFLVSVVLTGVAVWLLRSAVSYD